MNISFDCYIIGIPVAIALIAMDIIISGKAEERRSCTNREWRQRTKKLKGRQRLKNILFWSEIRDCVPKYLYGMHLTTLLAILLCLIFPLLSWLKIAGILLAFPVFWFGIVNYFNLVQYMLHEMRSPKTSLKDSIIYLGGLIASIIIIGMLVYKKLF